MKLFHTKIFILWSLVLCSQFESNGFKQVSRNMFSDGTKTGELHEFQDLFKQHDSCFKEFKKFNKTRTAVRISNYFFAVTGGVGVLASGFVLVFPVIGGGFAFLYTGAIGSLAIITNAITIEIKNNRKRKLLNCYFYGNEFTKTQFNIKSNIDLSLKISSSGLGLALTF